MKINILFATTFLLLSTNLFANDTANYSCKYKFVRQKDSSKVSSKDEDLMVLKMNKKSTTYFSYYKQYNNRLLDIAIENERSGKNYNAAGGNVTINATDVKTSNNKYGKESEVIKIDFVKKKINVSDRFVENAFYYLDTLITPVWQIQNETLTILNQQCQKATTSFLGRNYTAWFSAAIPYKFGPWLFNGLPGLILKAEDDKQQFLFECVELNCNKDIAAVYKDYEDCKKVSKQKLNATKKLDSQDPIA